MNKVALQAKALRDLKDAGQEPPPRRLPLTKFDSDAADVRGSEGEIRGDAEEPGAGAGPGRASAAGWRRKWTTSGGRSRSPARRRPGHRKSDDAPHDPAPMRSDLRQLVATGTVHCEMTDSTKKTQTIDCNRLTMQTATTPDGRCIRTRSTRTERSTPSTRIRILTAGHLAVAPP